MLGGEFHVNGEGNDAGAMAHFEQASHGFAAVVAVVERALVHVHPHKFIGKLRVQVAAKLLGILQRFIAVIERVLDGLTQCGSHFRDLFVGYVTNADFAVRKEDR